MIRLSNCRTIGMEGTHPEYLPVTWACAALSDGERLINPITGDVGPISEAAELASEGHLTLFVEPLPIVGGVVLRLQADLLSDDVLAAFAIAPAPDSAQIGDTLYATFPDLDAFKAYARPTADALVALAGGKDEATLRHARILDCHNPRANAAWALMAPPEKREIRRRIARATCRGADDIAEFDRLISEAP